MARKMKDSSIEWIGKIPENWETVRIKRCFKIISGSGFPIEKQGKENGDYPVCKASDIAKANEGGVLYSAANYLDKEEISGYNIVPKYSIIMPKIGEAMKKNNRAIVDCDVLIDNNCQGLFPISIYFKYAYYLFKIIDMNWFDNSGTIPSVNNTKLINSSIPCPSIKEQKKISNKLDSIVDYAKDIKSTIIQEIQTLENYKKSVITEAVTKGLDKNVEMKDSGVEWIGEIPKHWKVIRIKNAAILKARIGWQGLKSDEFLDDSNLPYLVTGTDFKDGLVDWDSCVRISEKRFEMDKNIQINENDLLITKDGTIGKLAIARNCPYKASLNSGVFVIRNKGTYEYNDKYMYYLLKSEQFYLWFELNDAGNSTIRHLYQRDFYNFSFTYPETKEQNDIVDYLDKKTKLIDDSIAIKQKQLETLEEYKKSLIYEYVTGKKEVNDGEET